MKPQPRKAIRRGPKDAPVYVSGQRAAGGWRRTGNCSWRRAAGSGRAVGSGQSLAGDASGLRRHERQPLTAIAVVELKRFSFECQAVVRERRKLETRTVFS